jgi:hypothetical protein
VDGPDQHVHYFHWDYLKDCVYCIIPRTDHELQVKIKAITEGITGDMLCDTADKFCGSFTLRLFKYKLKELIKGCYNSTDD